MPPQRVVERHALTHESLAVVDQQAQVKLWAVQLRRGQGVQALAHGRTGDRDRVDAVGLPAPAGAATRVGRQRGRDAHHALATRDQEPLQRARDVPAALQRPDPLAAQAPRPAAQAANPLAPTLTVCSPSTSPVVAATATIVCERLCASAPSTIMSLVHLHLD
jgi:hypothetical protein